MRMSYKKGKSAKSGKMPTTTREKALAAKYGNKKVITRGDIITAAKEKSGKRTMAMGGGIMRKTFGKGGGADRPGLYANIKAKKDRIKAGSGEKMRKPGAKGAPTAKNFRDAAKTAKKA
jgi:hypothetical protein